ncbi:SLOG family protein [Paraliobacillus sp. JSM ZJ581]|uniref:SLOG family protein n=1 Tax=Paraliobacillus sp. JSM ZJ581 TaxID=3342118 RepID=UPI0035A8427A
MNVLAVTGYKPHEMNISSVNDQRIRYIKETIKRRLLHLINEGIQWVLVSGQMGVEIWTCEVVIELKRVYAIKLAIVPPFDGQETRWPESIQQLYQNILMEADFVQLLYESTYKGAYQFKAKNKFMVDKSDACLLMIDEEFPGSNRFFLEEAMHKHKHVAYPIYYMTPLDLEDTMQAMIEEEQINTVND